LITLAASHAPAYDQVVTGVLGFLVVAGMGIALYFLLRSMNKQLRKVMREPRPREEAQAGRAAQAEPAQDYTHNGTPQA
jgi:large-conductance mechanosensitive channel